MPPTSAFFSSTTYVEPGLAEAVGGDEPGHAGADDRDPERPVGGDVVLAPRRRPQVLAQRELLAEQLEVVVDLGAAGDERQQRPQLVLAGGGIGRALGLHMDPPGPVPGHGDHQMLADLDADSLAALVAAVGPGTDAPILSFEFRHIGRALGGRQRAAARSARSRAGT